jgi:multiple sugar transport system substrate-binding protein
MTARFDRRDFLKGSTATAAAAGLEGILSAGRAPGQAQGTRLHLLEWSHFIPAADTLFDAQAKEFGKQAGVEIAIERINQNDIQARTTAAIQSGSGPDIIVINNNYPLLYEGALADVSDVADELGGKQGGWYDYAKVNCVAGNRWVAVPYFIISWAVTHREDWLKEAGFEYPTTWDDFRKAGRALKAKGKPFGQAFGHSINDPNAWCYPIVWMWGGMEVEKDGRRVVLNSKATLEALKFTLVLWKECFDEGGLAWDDSNNNRAFLSQEISLTGNAPSIYVAARQKFPDVYKGTNHGHYPPGPAGRFYWLPVYNSCVMKYSKNQRVARTSSATTWTGRSTTATSRSWIPSGSPAPRSTGTLRCGGRIPRPRCSPRRCSTRGRSATPVRPAARPPRPSASSSWWTCSPRASRECRPRTP